MPRNIGKPPGLLLFPAAPCGSGAIGHLVLLGPWFFVGIAGKSGFVSWLVATGWVDKTCCWGLDFSLVLQGKQGF